MDPTRTATQSLYLSEDEQPLGLVIVHHPDPRFVGSARVVDPGEVLTLGRADTSFAPGAFADSRISRKHVEISRLDEELVIRDLKSRNGTWLDGERIETGRMGPGQVLALGHVLLVVQALLRRPMPTRGSRLIGISSDLQQALALVHRVAPLELPVLVLGESGTGKELVAREVHDRSGRGGRFVPVNCAGMSDSLLQSELFGHIRGAFSGAERARRGLVEQARGGTLFLDEIGDASLGLQGALLRLLQEGEIRPVGADRPVKVDVRFLAATNRDLAAQVREGAFREDLYARLNRMVVRLPPLRERREDILPLAAYFASSFHGSQLRLAFPLAQRLLRHDWPGNARSLQAIVERLVIEHDEDGDLRLPPWLEEELAQHARREHPASSGQDATEAPEPPPRRELTQETLRERLLAHRGNVTAVAQELGMGRNTLYRHMKRLGVDLAEVRGALETG